MTRVRRRVAITGVGLVTPVGNDVATTWSALLAGRSGVAPITLFDASGFPVRIAAEVKGFDLERAIDDRKLLKFANRSHRFALAAAEQALRDAGIRPTAADAARWGCAVGTGMMGVAFDDLADVQRRAAPGGELDTAPPRSAPRARRPIRWCSAAARRPPGVALLPRRYGIRGYATSVHTACASGGQAIGTAMKLIRRGAADRVLAGGFDSMINPVGLGGFCLLTAVSPDNETPERASRPFDATRNGFVLGEGAGLPRARGVGVGAPRAARTSTPSSRATAIRCRAIASPTRIRRRRADPGDAPGARRRRRAARGGRLPERPRHLDADERPQRDARRCNAVFGARREAGRGQLDQELDGAPDRRRRRGRGGGLRARDPRTASCRSTRTCASSTPTATSTSCAARRAARRVRIAMSNSFGFGGSNSCLVLRHPEEVDGAADGTTTCRSSSPAPARSAAPARTPAEILGAVRAGRSAIAPDRAVGRVALAGAVAAEIADFNPRALLNDRKLLKLIRRTDVFGLYAAGQAIDAAGLAAHRDALDAEAAARFSDRTGVYVGSGGGNYENQYDYFPLLTAADGEPAGVRARARRAR